MSTSPSRVPSSDQRCRRGEASSSVSVSEPVAHCVRVAQRRRPLGHDLDQRCECIGTDRDSDHAAERCIEVGLQHEIITVGAYEDQFGDRVVDHPLRRTDLGSAVMVRRRQCPKPVPVLGALVDRDDHPTIIMAQLGIEDDLVVLREVRQELIFRLRRTDAVQHQPRCAHRAGGGAAHVPRPVVPGVDVRRAVRQPEGDPELGLDRRVVDVLAGVDVADPEVEPVASGLGDRVQDTVGRPG